MENVKRLKLIIFIFLVIWVGTAIVGCSQTNSISSLNPVGSEENPESSINVPTDSGKSANRAPVVNVIAQETVVGVGSELQLRAEAIDPDGDKLDFTWNSSEGILTTTSNGYAVWKAPEVSSIATISCTVDDGKGLFVSSSVIVEVLGNGIYTLTVVADRSALITGRIAQQENLLSVPLAGARIEVEATNQVAVTDSSGKIELNVDQSDKIATTSRVIVKYLDWEIAYEATLKPYNGNKVQDEVKFYPGFDNISVAVARGDSFSLKRGAVEVTAYENTYGDVKPLPEVTVDVGSSQGVSAMKTGVALVSSPVINSGELNLSLSKSGYQRVEGYKIPVALDGVTIVNAKLSKSGGIPDSEAILTWTKPYNSMTEFPVTGPFEIGFGQPMDKANIFQDIRLMIQNKENSSLLAFDGDSIKNNFRVEWEGDTILRLYPLRPLAASSRYSMLISRWNAKASDGRVLKNYDGMYGEFLTATDPAPEILSTSPINGDLNVGRTGPFVLNFSRPMQKETLYDGLLIEITNKKSGSKVVLNGTTIRSYFSETWKNGNSTLELVPYKMLSANTQYLIKLISTGLKSNSGKGIQDLSNLWGQFTTADL